MAITNFVKRIQDVMRNDAGVNGDAQRIEQIVWTLFLKIYDAKEEEWELINDDYVSIIPDEYKWRNWAVDNKDGQALTGDALLDFVNNKLFPTLKNLEVSEDTPMNQMMVRYAFEDANNYMKDVFEIDGCMELKKTYKESFEKKVKNSMMKELCFSLEQEAGHFLKG